MGRARSVVGVEGSAAAAQAVAWAARLTALLGAEVVAVHGVGLLEDLHEPSEGPAARRAGSSAGARMSGPPKSSATSPPSCWLSARMAMQRPALRSGWTARPAR